MFDLPLSNSILTKYQKSLYYYLSITPHLIKHLNWSFAVSPATLDVSYDKEKVTLQKAREETQINRNYFYPFAAELPDHFTISDEFITLMPIAVVNKFVE